MLKIADLTGRELDWTQPAAFVRDYELRAGTDLVATLKLRSGFGTLATAESGDGCWTFKRVGFWDPRASVRACGAEEDLATFRNNTWSSGGTLVLADGREFRATTNFWNTHFEFLDGESEPIVRLRYGSGILHTSAHVQIAKSAAWLSEIPIIVLFNWYLAVMLQMDADAAAVITAIG
jgi:hypothetical protein